MPAKILPWLLLVFFACAQHTDQEPPAQVGESTEMASDTILPVFPDDFLGRWSGDLNIWRGDGLAQSIGMQLHIEPVDDTTYTYTIRYGEDDEREYLLKEKDRAKGLWYIDEQNGIYLDGYYVGGKFFEGFGVMDTRLMATLELRGDELLYEITSGPEGPVRSSGDTIIDEEEIPEVFSYEMSTFHRATLARE
ncbi:MAG: hypothetical protein AAF741_06485 [Bacteroidota bacterium]